MNDSDVDSLSESCGANYGENKTKITFLNTNARSLCPKIESLIDCFGELEAAFGVVTGHGSRTASNY